MNKEKKMTFLIFAFLMIAIITSCVKVDSQNQKNGIQVKFIEKVCCGNFMTLQNRLIESSCQAYKDSLLSPINSDDFPIFQSLQVGDIITIEYELTEYCEATCDITCNRMNGIPIKLLSMEK